MARTKWTKPENDNFISDMKKAARSAAVRTEERNFTAVADAETGVFAKRIPLELLEDAPWNERRDIRRDVELFERMRKSILRVGLLSPIVVWEKENKDGYYILSGHSRRRVFEYLHKEEGVEEYKEIYAFIRPYESLTEEEAIDIVLDGNIQRGRAIKSEEILELGVEIKRYEKEAEQIFRESPGQYERVRDVLGEMLGRKDGKDVDNIRSLCSLPREVLELIDTTPITKTHLLNPIMKDVDVQNVLLAYKNNINKDFTSMIKPGVTKDELQTALVEGVIEPEPDVITITVPDGFGYDLAGALELCLETEGLKADEFTVKVKRKRKKTAH